MSDAPEIPGLTILDELGSGGFGVVYRARQPALERDIAVKLENRVLTGEDRTKFLREARAAARLSGHPNVVNVFDAGVTTDGRPYIVMELCTGGSLADVIAQQGPLPLDRVVDIGLRLADALGHAHSMGVLHRDIKPANVLIDAFGSVKLADFGLAAILDSQVEGTITLGALSPAYAAPEAFAWGAPSAAADVYSLAATLYTLATGRNPRDIPWPPQSLEHLAACLRIQVEPIPGAPANVNAALIRALATDLAVRTPSARLLAEELGGTRPVPALPRPRRRVGFAAAAIVVVLASAGAGVYYLVNRPDTAEGAAAPPVVVTPPPRLQDCAGSDVNGYCVTEACYGGLIQMNDERRASLRDCTGEHSWEAFSGGWLPDGAIERAIDEIEKLPEVQKACSPTVKTARTKPGSDTSTWIHSVLASAQNGGGKAYFYCLAKPETGTVTGRMFTTG